MFYKLSNDIDTVTMVLMAIGFLAIIIGMILRHYGDLE